MSQQHIGLVAAAVVLALFLYTLWLSTQRTPLERFITHAKTALWSVVLPITLIVLLAMGVGFLRVVIPYAQDIHEPLAPAVGDAIGIARVLSFVGVSAWIGWLLGTNTK